MKIEGTAIHGLWRVIIERQEDERGSFGRTFSSVEFTERGLASCFVQASSSWTRKAGTLRGMHLQIPPHGEAKLVRCVRGVIHDVVCDLRIGSTTYLQHRSFRLHEDGDDALYIPPGCAHGFQTLVDDVEVTYAMSCAFAPGSAVGLRYDDPALGIAWPSPVTCISSKDLGWEDYRGAAWRHAVQFEAVAPDAEATSGEDA